MRDTFRRAAALTALWSAAIFTNTTIVAAQAPTQAQRAAIKSQCRSDYMAHCSSIAPGGAASLQCLQKNLASLAPGCQAAVQAVTGSSEAKSEPVSGPKSEPATESKPETAAAPATETKTEPTPATTTATPAAPAAASASKSAGMKKPSSVQASAVRSACRSDYPKVCAGVPTGGAQALQCLEKNKASLSPACQNAVAAVAGGAAAPAGSAPAQEAAASPAAPAAAPAAPSSAPPVIVLRPMRPREVLFVMRSACGADVRTLCAGVDPGGGRILQCLVSNASSLSPDCRAVLSHFAAR